MKTAFYQCADTTCPRTQPALPMLNLSEVGNLAIVAKLSGSDKLKGLTNLSEVGNLAIVAKLPESDKFHPAWPLLQNRKLCITNFVLGLNNGYMEVLNA